MWHDHDDQIIGYWVAEKDLTMESSRNGTKYCDCFTDVLDAHGFRRYCREKLLKTEVH